MNQWAELARVRTGLAGELLGFASILGPEHEFTMRDVLDYFALVGVQCEADSPRRIFRELRTEGVLNYVNVRRGVWKFERSEQ